ncbi:MAG TPA: DUF456 family protein [Anaerolineales bacterium]
MPVDPGFWSLVVLQGITLAVLLIGWAGLLIPVFPGLIVMWLATLFYALLANEAGHMAWIDWTLFALITLLMIAGSIVDNIIIARKMRGRHVPWRSILLAYLAGLVVSAFFTPIIGLLASPLALYGAETRRLHDRKLGFESARAYMIAWGWAFIAVFAIGAMMIILWLLWAFL